MGGGGMGWCKKRWCKNPTCILGRKRTGGYLWILGNVVLSNARTEIKNQEKKQKKLRWGRAL